jgi:hypothetical protein
MPVWQDAERFNIKIHDPSDPYYSWSHCGMDAQQAQKLLTQTLDDVRWKNDTAIHYLWQPEYESPLSPALDRASSHRLQKIVERYAMLPTVTEPGSDLHQSVVHDLNQLGVTTTDQEAPGKSQAAIAA